MLSTICLIFGIICFVIEAFKPLSKTPSRVGFMWLGFAFWMLSILLRGVNIGHIG
jgi:hypothetical protein